MKSQVFWYLLLLLVLPTSRGWRWKLILIDGANQAVKTAHNVVNAPDHYSVSGVL